MLVNFDLFNETLAYSTILISWEDAFVTALIIFSNKKNLIEYKTKKFFEK